MISKKLFIFQYKDLFNILDEIKEYLNFEIILVEKNDFENHLKDENSDYLIISKNKKNNFKNLILLNELPIDINRLTQIINLRFLKNQYAYQSEIKIGPYNLNLNSRQIEKDNKKLSLTERESNLIIYLNESSSAVKTEKLQKEVWEYGSKLDTHTVETHIYRLRKKIKDKFDDDNFIISSKEGYLIH